MSFVVQSHDQGAEKPISVRLDRQFSLFRMNTGMIFARRSGAGAHCALPCTHTTCRSVVSCYDVLAGPFEAQCNCRVELGFVVMASALLAPNRQMISVFIETACCLNHCQRHTATLLSFHTRCVHVIDIDLSLEKKSRTKYSGEKFCPHSHSPATFPAGQTWWW